MSNLPLFALKVFPAVRSVRLLVLVYKQGLASNSVLFVVFFNLRLAKRLPKQRHLSSSILGDAIAQSPKKHQQWRKKNIRLLPLPSQSLTGNSTAMLMISKFQANSKSGRQAFCIFSTNENPFAFLRRHQQHRVTDKTIGVPVRI